MSLLQRISDLELSLRQSETMRENLSHKQQEDSVELATLRKACQIQKEDIAQFERYQTTRISTNKLTVSYSLASI